MRRESKKSVNQLDLNAREISLGLAAEFDSYGVKYNAGDPF